MKSIYYLIVFLVALSITSAYALTPEEILLLKRAGVPDEKILEIQKKDGTAPPLRQSTHLTGMRMARRILSPVRTVAKFMSILILGQIPSRYLISQ